MNKVKVKSILLIVCTVVVWNCTAPARQDNVLLDLHDAAALDLVGKSTGVDLELSSAEGKAALTVIADGTHPVPSFIVHQGKEKWNLSHYKFIAMDITNPGSEDLLVECRLLGDSWFGCGQIIPAGKTRTLRAYIVRSDYPAHIDRSFKAMNALPGGLVSMFYSPPPDSITHFSVVMIGPPKDAIMQIRNIRGEDSVKVLSEKELADHYFPFIDALGQFQHKEWPGKATSWDDLQKSRATEGEDLQKNTSPEAWNKYGGWLNGPKLKATGHFRTEKVDGKWWLVDPDGYLFWSHGMGTVDLSGYTTPITEREHYFTDLPDSLEFKQFYSWESYNPKGYYKDRTVKTFNHYAWNLFKKYGDDWENKSAQLAHTRLKSWGQNTIGGWSSADIYSRSLTPYTTTLELRTAPIEGSEGQWGKFPDPYHPSLAEEIRQSIRANEKSVSDPYCIGYFVDNELSWGNDAYLAKAIISSPKDQPAKIAMMQWLKEKYGSIAVLNTGWKTSYTSWDDFLKTTKVPQAEVEDLTEFTGVVTDHYFKTIQQTLRAVIPHKLYLGCRFDFHFYPSEDKSNDWLVKIAAKYCDVVSFNRYRYSAIDLAPADADKPVMIGEWHVGALDRGMLHYSLKFAEDQDNRAELYQHYLKSCLKNPHIVGAHWFEYVDEPVAGRFDGENYNTGFLDVCDRPYPEMVEASREIGKIMYTYRQQQK